MDKLFTEKKDTSQYIIVGDKWGNTNFRIGDELNAIYIQDTILNDIEDKTASKIKLNFEDLITIVSDMTKDLLNLAHKILVNFYENHMKDKCETSEYNTN